MTTDDECRRYRRQMALPEIGRDGQRRLAAGKVLVAGLGGLGSVTAYYLAAAGVGYLKLVDRDCVSPENLNRQILHATDDIGRPKTASAADKLSRLNPHCRLETVHGAIGSENVETIMGDCRLICDATDNRETRQALNRVSVKTGVPFVYGGINGWEGMAATFIPGRTACFGCLFPPRDAPDRPEAPPPVLGPVAGIVASIQCLETVRLLIGRPAGLAGRLLRFSGTTFDFRALPIERDPDCGVCGRQSPKSA